MKNNPLISIIIPVYNCEAYISQCLDSLLTQTYNNLEIIAVNDGSTDKSLTILSEYARRNPRLVVIDKPNGGVSSARNIALDKLSGEYLFFLDADDFININCIEILFKAITSSKNTIAMAHTYRLDGKKRMFHETGYSKDQDLMSYDEFNAKLLSGRINAFIWGKLFPSVFLEEIRFSQALSHGEDLLLLVTIFQKYKVDIQICKNAFYQYRINEESATGTFSEKSINSNINKLIKISSLPLPRGDKNNFLALVYFEYWLLCKKISLEPTISFTVKIQNIKKINELLRANGICNFWSLKAGNAKPMYHLLALPFSFLNTPVIGIMGCIIVYSMYTPKNIYQYQFTTKVSP